MTEVVADSSSYKRNEVELIKFEYASQFPMREHSVTHLRNVDSVQIIVILYFLVICPHHFVQKEWQLLFIDNFIDAEVLKNLLSNYWKDVIAFNLSFKF